MGGRAAILVEDLGKIYHDVVAVDGVSLTVSAGEIVAVLGPNGAGKTSIIEILEGFRSRTAGVVEVLGLDPDERGRELRCRIGVVLQSCQADPYLTTRETIDLFRGYYPNPRSADDLIQIFGLTDQANRRVAKLSGGQQRRLDLALALTGQPELLFLDEPTTGLDPVARRETWDTILQLREVGTTVLLTTHYLEEAEMLADRLLVLVDGKIAAEGTPGSIGGRGEVTRISFDSHAFDAAGCPLAMTNDGDRWSIDVTEPLPALAQLTSWAIDVGSELPNLTVGRRSLEDVYLDMIK